MSPSVVGIFLTHVAIEDKIGEGLERSTRLLDWTFKQIANEIDADCGKRNELFRGQALSHLIKPRGVASELMLVVFIAERRRDTRPVGNSNISVLTQSQSTSLEPSAAPFVACSRQSGHRARDAISLSANCWSRVSICITMTRACGFGT